MILIPKQVQRTGNAFVSHTFSSYVYVSSNTWFTFYHKWSIRVALIRLVIHIINNDVFSASIT